MKRLFIVVAVAALGLPVAYAGASGDTAEGRTTTICHRTASAKKPYVKLRVSARALRAHGRHAADIVPAPRGGCPRSVLTAGGGGTALTVALTGEAEIPAGDPVATGTATIRARRGQGQVCYVLDVANLGGAAAAAHIHRAAAGAVGGIVVTLGTPDADGRARGCVRAARSVVSQLLASPAGFYVNVHTAAFPGGAVRGQLAGTSTSALGTRFVLQLTGTAERPAAGDPDGAGTAVVRIRREENQVCYRVTVQNVQLPTAGAHIHRAPATAAGPIVVPFEAPGATGTSAGCTAADRALIDEILANPANFYVNVHTREFPAGAVRAQLA